MSHVTNLTPASDTPTRWQRAAEAAANLDALAALAVAAEELAAACPDVCTPKVLPPPTTSDGEAGEGEPYLRAVGLRHPCVAALTSVGLYTLRIQFTHSA